MSYAIKDEEFVQKERRRQKILKEGKEIQDDDVNLLLGGESNEDKYKPQELTLQYLQDYTVGCEIVVVQKKGLVCLYASDDDAHNKFGTRPEHLLELVEENKGFQDDFLSLENHSGEEISHLYFYGVDGKSKKRANYAHNLDKIVINDAIKHYPLLGKEM